VNWELVCFLFKKKCGACGVIFKEGYRSPEPFYFSDHTSRDMIYRCSACYEKEKR